LQKVWDAEVAAVAAAAPSDSDCTNICSPAMAALSPLRQELVDNRKKQSTLDSF
jgi:hypothetical protein